MTNLKHTFTLLALSIALWGCADKQQFGEEIAETETKLTVNLPASKATADTPTSESAIHCVRVLVVAAEGTTREGKVTGNMFFENLTGSKLEALAISGISDIYVLANEPEDQREALNKIASVQQLEKALVLFKPLEGGDTAYKELPMMALIPNVTIAIDSKKNNFNATLKRLWAKFNIRFKADQTYIDQVKLTSIELQSLPKYSYWLDAHPYPETNFTKGTKTELNATKGILISGTPTEPIVLYAPEYLVNDPDAHTRLIVRGHKEDTPEIVCVYRVALGNNPYPETEDEVVDYNIHRNTRYDITGVIKGYGGGDVEIEMTVNPWDEKLEIEGETGGYLKVDKLEETLTFNLPKKIEITTSDLSGLKITSANNKVVWSRTDNQLTIHATEAAADSEPIEKFDEVTITLGSQKQTIKIGYKPCMAQQFAKGMLIPDWNGGVDIGAPNADPKYNLLFKFGRPMGLLALGVITDPYDVKLVYNPLNWPYGITFNPGGGNETEFLGGGKDYWEHLMTDTNKPGTVYNDIYAGDVCRMMGKKDEHFWRIPTLDELWALVNEGKQAVLMSGEKLQDSGDPTADFGWFFGPTASGQGKSNVANPKKGSIFVYNLRYATGNTPVLTMGGTLNILSSSNYGFDNNGYARMYYLTANGIALGRGSQTQFNHSFGIRCIRDYSRTR